MAPLFVRLNKTAPWSPCSSLYITEFFDNGHGRKYFRLTHGLLRQQQLLVVLRQIHIQNKTYCCSSHILMMSFLLKHALLKLQVVRIVYRYF